MAVEIYIGNEALDFQGDASVIRTIGDIAEFNSGGIESSYTIDIKLTDKNKRLLNYSNELNVFEEVSLSGKILIDGIELISGKIIILSFTDIVAQIIIKNTSWIDDITDLKMRDLDLSAYDEVFNSTNVVASWTGTANFIRYAMIQWGRLFSQQDGITANHVPNDFVPMFNMVKIVKKIFAAWTIAGNWATDYAEHYVLCSEPVLSSDFIAEKKLSVQTTLASDNENSTSVPAYTTMDIYYTAKVVFNTITTDEGSDFSNADDWYVVPETGTYNFIFALAMANSFTLLTINSQYLNITFKCSRSGVITTIKQHSFTYAGSDILDDAHTLESGFVHLIAGDKVYLTWEFNQNMTNAGAVPRPVNTNISASCALTSTPDKRNLYPGIGKTIEAEKYMPDITQLAFVSALKEAYNLRFIVDNYTRTIYIDNADDNYTLNETTISLIDYSQKLSTENISSKYYSIERLKFVKDASDYAVTQYLLENAEPVKDVVLTSNYAQSGVNIRNNSLFAWTAEGDCRFIAGIVIAPQIYGDGEKDTVWDQPLFRATNFSPRLLQWDGLTGGGHNWYYELTNESTYPKCSPVLMSTLFNECMLKTWHFIDKGKLLKIKIPMDVLLTQKFHMIINDVNEEGFRARYKIQVGNEWYLGYCNKIEYNRSSILMELILLH